MKGALHAWVIAALLMVAPAHAHVLNMTEMALRVQTSGVSTLDVRIDLGQSLMSADAYWRSVNAPPEVQAQLVAAALLELQQGIQVTVNGERVALGRESVSLQATSLDAIRNPLTPQMASVRFQLPARPGDEVELRLEDALSVPWPCLLRVDVPGAETPISRLLTEGTRTSRPVALVAGEQATDASWLVSMASAWQAWVPGITWVAVGYQHIVPMGLDHIVFILGLFFLAPKLSTLLWQVTCFTVAHSLTLALASLGVVSVSSAIVEPLIAASIVYVAIDNLYSDRLARWRMLVVTAFGLLHGLGFASALSAIQIPPDAFLSSLLLFNVGVELGQLSVLAVAFLAVGWLRHWSGYDDRVARPATVTIAGVGAYWLLKRVVF